MPLTRAPLSSLGESLSPVSRQSNGETHREFHHFASWLANVRSTETDRYRLAKHDTCTGCFEAESCLEYFSPLWGLIYSLTCYDGH